MTPGWSERVQRVAGRLLCVGRGSPPTEQDADHVTCSVALSALLLCYSQDDRAECIPNESP